MMKNLDYNPENVWQVYPVNDLKEHKLKGFGCKCGVKIEILENKGVIVTHKSYDQREVYEKVREEN